MSGRLIDVLTNEEKCLRQEVARLQGEASRLQAEALEWKGMAKAVEARIEGLKKQAADLKVNIVDAETRVNPDLAEAAYRAMKPDRYDVVLYVLERLDLGFARMWCGNVSKVIFEGPIPEARQIARRLADLVGQACLKEVRVDSKQEIWKK